MFKKLSQEYGTTVIVSSHILNELEHTATRFGIMDHGRVLCEITHKDLKVRSDKIYSNQGKFAAVFKKQFGLSPLEYRRSKNLENI